MFNSSTSYGNRGPLSQINARCFSYGFQGQEEDDEIAGVGNHYTADYWEYDSRTARRWNADPVVKPHESPYACFANNPIWFTDVNGADTSNVSETLNKTASTNAFNDLMKISPEFANFFNSFTGDGKNKNITLRFTTTNDPNEKGSAQLMYKGQWVQDLNSIPANADLADFEILLSINPKLFYSGSETNEADRTVTLVHELMLHAYKETQLLNKYRNACSVDGLGLLKEHKEHYGADGDHQEMTVNEYQHTANYTMPAKITYRQVIEYYSTSTPSRMTNQSIPGVKRKKFFHEFIKEEYDNEKTKDKKKKQFKM